MQNHGTSKDAITLNEVLYHNTEKTPSQTMFHIKATSEINVTFWERNL